MRAFYLKQVFKIAEIAILSIIVLSQRLVAENYLQKGHMR
jgi:hypothetical protein